jgi:hypothetical protein
MRGVQSTLSAESPPYSRLVSRASPALSTESAPAIPRKTRHLEAYVVVGHRREVSFHDRAEAAALYVRVSTDHHQSVESQNRGLRQIAERRGWKVVEVYSAVGISGVKRRDKRPGLNAMLNDASRRKFDIVMAWAIDRLGRSLIDLLDTFEHLEAAPAASPQEGRTEPGGWQYVGR